MRWINIKCDVLALLLSMLGTDPSKRPSCRDIKEIDDWKIEINDIIEDPLLYSIAVNKDIDKVKMSPLSHYIIHNKLRMHRERNLEEFRKNRSWADNENWHGFYWHWMDELDQIADTIISDKLTIASNLDENMQKDCMSIIKHAFAVHSTPELIKHFIIDNLPTPNPFGDWKCLIYRDYILGNDFELINWDNVLYFHAYNIEMVKCVKIFIYYLEVDSTITPSGSRLFSYPPIQKPKIPSIIINQFNEDTTDSLFQFVEAQEDRILYINNDKNKDSEYVTSSDPNLEILREILGDQSAFYYISKQTKFLLYHQNFISVNKTQLMLDCKCKFAATIGEVRFAIFTYSHSQSDENLLQLSFIRNNNDVSQIRIIFRDEYN